MISSARLLQPIQVGPRSTANHETTGLPPKRDGLSVVMTAEGPGLLVAWKAGGEAGEVLVPWSNVRDVYGDRIFPARAAPKSTAR